MSLFFVPFTPLGLRGPTMSYAEHRGLQPTHVRGVISFMAFNPDNAADGQIQSVTRRKTRAGTTANRRSYIARKSKCIRQLDPARTYPAHGLSLLRARATRTYSRWSLTWPYTAANVHGGITY